MLIVLAFSFQMLAFPLQLMLAQTPLCTTLIAWYLTLLLAGAALGPLLFVRNGFRRSPSENRLFCPCPIHIRAGVLLLLIWAGEICGRVLFYSGYTWFGM